MVDTHLPFPKQFATIRTDTMEPIGVVGEKYEILQNIEAFNFLDSLVGDAKFETAGLYGGGSKSFITMSTEPIKILDDEFAPYILFTNAFDGSGAVRVMLPPHQSILAIVLQGLLRMLPIISALSIVVP